jgi:hypothetical protein
MATRLTQVALEAIGSPLPDALVTQIALEAIGSPAPSAHVTQAALETLGSIVSTARVGQVAVEVLLVPHLVFPSTPTVRSIVVTVESNVASSVSPYSGQMQTLSWAARRSSLHLELPPMLASVAGSLIDFLVMNGRNATSFALPVYITQYLPIGLVPGGAWRLKNPGQVVTVSEAVLYGIELDISEAVGVTF